ncbi:unnamed protein product [Parajaminaea phylloscopi]
MVAKRLVRSGSDVECVIDVQSASRSAPRRRHWRSAVAATLWTASDSRPDPPATAQCVRACVRACVRECWTRPAFRNAQLAHPSYRPAAKFLSFIALPTMAAEGSSSQDAGPATEVAQTSSKFSTLPDIDTSAVDVYETPSSPELKPVKHTTRSHTTSAAGGFRGGDDDDDDDSDASLDGLGRSGAAQGEDEAVTAARRRRRKAQQNDDGRGEIDRKGITTEEAKSRFENSTDPTVQGHSSAVRRRRSRRRRASDDYLDSELYELEGSSSRAKETPLAKLRRLRLEAAELEEELRKEAQEHKQDGPAESEAGDSGMGENARKLQQPTTDAIVRQLRSLRFSLDEVGPIEQTAPSPSSSTRPVQAAKAALSGLDAPTDGHASANGLATGSATSSPAMTTQNAHLADIDERLAVLEQVVGTSQGVLEETQSLARPLLPTVARLEQMAAILSQPRHIDAVSKRIKLLVAELDRVYEARRKLAALPNSNSAGAVVADASASSNGPDADKTAPLDPITLSKLDDAFALCSRVQTLLPLAPALLQRLRSLSQLHASASDFATTLDNVDQSQRQVEAQLSEMAGALKEVGDSLKENEARVKGNLEIVMQRMEDLDKRIAAL